MASSPGNAAPKRGGAPKSRPRELEDRLNRLVYHPLAARLARLLEPTPLTPNMVSVAGLLLVWGAAFAYTGLAWPIGFLIGFPLHLLWHVVDGADGDLARLRGTQSATGELVDGVCDYAGHVLLYILLAAMLDDWIGGWSWFLASLAGASHIAQTNHAETQRRSYLWWVYGVPWLKHARTRDDEVFRARNWFSFTFGWMARLYLNLANAMTPESARVDAALQVAAGDPAEIERIRAVARREFAPTLVYEQILGPNPRTLILGASMALGSPLYYFLAETILLNLVLLVSVRRHNQAGRRLVSAIG